MVNKRFIRGIAALLAAVCLIVQGASIYALSAEADINQMLGTKSYEIVATDSDEPSYYYTRKTANLDEHMANKLAIIEDLADEGIVLVKNNGSLPLTSGGKITLLGCSSVNPVYNGSGGNAKIGNVGKDVINIPLKTGFEKAGFQVNPSMWDYYKANSKTESAPEALPTQDLAAYSDAVIVVLTRNAGEGSDKVYPYYQLTAEELALVDFAKTISDTVIVINNSPSPLSCDELERDSGVDAIIVAGGLGARGAISLANIIRGTVNPSGRLPDTYAADSRSSAAFQSAGTNAYTNAAAISAASALGEAESNQKYTIQYESIYVGYKYYETRYEDVVLKQGNAASVMGTYKSKGAWSYADEVTYSFGHGLSYTSFSQEITAFDVTNGVVSITVKVKNTGNVAGKDVVQLYVQTPYTQYDKDNLVEKSAIQLVNFGKTDLLQPGAEQSVTIKMDLYNIASYDYMKAKTWILDDGSYYFAIGNGAHEALNNVLAAKGKTTADGMTANGNAALVKTWENPDFITLSTPTFTANGFTTVNGLYHNNVDTAVTNQLESADLNTYLGEGTVTYVTRSDWAGTWPTGIQSVTATAEMIKELAFTYEPGEPVGEDVLYDQLTNYDISALIGLEYDDPLWQNILEQMTVEEMIYTVGKNFGAIDPILSINFPGTSDNDGVGSGPCKGYQAAYNTGSTPFEGITNYSDVEPMMYPSETLGASTFNQALIYALGENQSEDCYYTELNTLWGPGLNMHRTPYSGRNFEYYSEDSMLSYIMGAQVVAGVQSNGNVAGPKHFVFNDQETDRYGYAVWLSEQQAREFSLRGFEGAIAVAKAGNVMSSLNRIGCNWAGACDATQNKIMRGEWGSLAYLITDNAAKPFMYARSIVYGNDKMMLLPGNDRAGELNRPAMLADSKLFMAVRESCHRILYNYVNSTAMNGTYAGMKIVPVTPWWKTALTVANVTLSVLAVGAIALYIISEAKARKKSKEVA